MDFTREPIIETIITPKDGYKLVVRSSKGVTQEEYFLEAVQIVSYGNAFFFRSTELPKSFLVPVSDYELVEVRETRVALKSAAPDRAIKIGGGREASLRPMREPIGKELPLREAIREPATESARELVREPAYSKESERTEGAQSIASLAPIAAAPDKKRDRRRTPRRRRTDHPDVEERRELLPLAEPAAAASGQALFPEKREFSTSLTSILPPPSHLIADTIHQYRGSQLFKDIFHSSDEEEKGVEATHETISASLSGTQDERSNELLRERHDAILGAETQVAESTGAVGSLFLKPPPSLVHESVSSEMETTLNPSEESNQKAFLLEVLSQRDDEKAAPSNREAAEEPFYRVESLAVSKQQEEPDVSAEGQETKMPETPSSSFWPTSFGQAHRKQHEEDEDHPLPL